MRTAADGALGRLVREAEAQAPGVALGGIEIGAGNFDGSPEG